MAIELGALELPITATGREAVLKALADIDRAAEKTSAARTVPISAPGAKATADALKGTESAALGVTRRIMEQQAQVRTNQDAIRRLEAQARASFQRIGLDVARATADYRLGIISLEDYQTAIRVAREEAIRLRQESGALSARQLAQFDKVLGDISKSARSARREGRGLASDFSSAAVVLNQQAGTARAGVTRVTSALSQMAVMALGTRSAVGSLATGALISLGASAAVTLSVVAAAALIGFAWEKLTRQSRETKEAVKELREELNKPTKQDETLKGVKLLSDAVAEGERRLAALRRGTDVFDRATGGIRTIAPDPRIIAKAEADLAKLRADLGKATDQVAELRQEAFAEETATLAKAIALRTASARQIQVATERMRLLDAAAKDETATLAEQNRAQEEANQLRSAFKKIADEEAEAAKENAEARKRQLQALLALAQINDLTAAQLATLRQRYDDVTAALERGNQSLEERKRLQDESRATFEALQAVGAATSFTRTTGGSTFGQPLEFEQPKTPSLDNLTFGADQDTTSSFFGGGALDGLTEQLDQQAQQASDRVKDAIANVQGQIDTSLDELHTTLAEGLTQSLVDGIAEGFERGIASGSIGEGAKALTAALLSGVGSAAISFGVASLGIAKLMLIIKKALSTLNPAVAIPAAIGLIALGAALKGAASRMFGGSGGSSGGADSPPPPQGSRLTLDERGTITNREPIPAASVRAPATERVRAIASLPPAPRESARVMAPATAAQQASKVEPARVVVQQSFTLLGAADPQTQRFISEASNAGARRGLKFGTAHHG